MAGTVINRGNNKWELRVSMGYDENGKQIRKTKRITATSMRAARKALDEFYWELMSAPRGDNGKQITFGEFVKIWKEKHNTKKSITTQDTHNRLLNYRILDAFQGYKLDSITGEQILQFIERLRQPNMNLRSKDKEKRLSATAVHKHFKLINHLFNKAVEWKFIAKNPCDDIPRDEWPKPKYHHYPIWEEDDLQNFLKLLNGLPDKPSDIKHKAMFYLALLCGARAGEIYALTWGDIDWKNHIVHINKSQKYMSAENREISKPKTPESVRDVYVDDYVIELLKKHQKNQVRYLSNKGYDNPHGYILALLQF